ncbi:MAG: TetR/AcrR family transcriptional regulator [Treponema sp.]|jgi:AcrR family transcriptional regulator|nr:TetR/AcrR family transcriptional regulator [Treponema sp.]
MVKQDIIRAAFRIWGRELYQTTSLTRIARDLGVTKPALYRHFKNKQALLDAMYGYFFDSYAASIKADYDRAIAAADPKEGLLIMIRVIVAYFARHWDAAVFSLVKIYGNREVKKLGEQMRARGIDLRKLGHFEGDPRQYPSMIQMIISTAIFWVGWFHRYGYEGEAPSEEAVLNMVSFVEAKISHGLGFNRSVVEAINYEELESRVCAMPLEPVEEDRILRAVAGTVAELGPWEASMDMIARRSGLSKSSLYAHFKNKQDMLRRFFAAEFERIFAYVEAGIGKSAVPEEQFYLAIAAIANYLCFRLEILAAVDWLRTRGFGWESLGPPFPIARIFSNITVPGVEPVSERISLWILFLIVNTLMWRPRGEPSCPAEDPEGPLRRRPESVFSEGENFNFRMLYKFIALGL